VKEKESFSTKIRGGSPYESQRGSGSSAEKEGLYRRSLLLFGGEEKKKGKGNVSILTRIDKIEEEDYHTKSKLDGRARTS